MKFLHFNFLPRSADFALLVLRIWFGGAMLFLHGWGKLTGFSTLVTKFADPFGIGKPASLGLVVFAELVCAGLLAVGAFTRFAALVLIVNMATAFWMAHGGKLAGPGSGEMAFVYLGAFIVLFIAGAGKFSVDAKIGAKG